MNLLAAINTAALTVELFSAALFTIAYLRRTSDVEHGIAAVVGVAAACHASAALFGAHASSPFAVAAAGFFGRAGLAVAVPAAAHFVVAYRGAERSWRSLGAMYAVAAAAAAWDVFEAGTPPGLAPHDWTSRAGTGSFRRVWPPTASPSSPRWRPSSSPRTPTWKAGEKAWPW